jgi:Lon protease-like protein
MSEYTSNTLPKIIPIFPLPGVLLLPFAKLPLNVFEPRYVAMTRDALKSNWIIGMIQPLAIASSKEQPDIYLVGCAGKIVTFSETDDGRFLITLNGIARFTVKEELPLIRGYRRTAIDWHPFEKDMRADNSSVIDRPRLENVLRKYFDTRRINARWDEIEQAPDSQLVATLAMQCPFTFEEKQALLEAPSIEDRAELIVSLLTMAVAGDLNSSVARH